MSENERMLRPDSDTSQAGSEISAADIVCLPRADSLAPSSEECSSRQPLPTHQYSPASLVNTPSFQEYLARNSQTHLEALRTLQQLEAYRVNHTYCL